MNVRLNFDGEVEELSYRVFRMNNKDGFTQQELDSIERRLEAEGKVDLSEYVYQGGECTLERI